LSPDEADRFIRAATRIDSPSLVPELRLHLSDEVTPLWEATEATLREIGIPPPYWAFAWPGGQALARTMLERPALVAGRTVLDFAAGSGIAAIAAMRAGAKRASASEIDALAVRAILLNAALNDVAVEALLEDATQGDPARWQVILAGDVCYEAPMSARVLPWLRRAAGAGVLVLLADPGRAYVPRDGLVLVAEYAVPTTLDLEDRMVRETRIWRLEAE